MNNKQDVRPAALGKYWEKRNQAFASMSRTARRIKIEQNHTWKLRMLPVQMGPDKEPFVDIAQHWWNKSPITCPKHTPEAWGGDPGYPCPVCEISERLINSSSDEINGIGFRVRCNLRIRSWCVVFDMEDQRGNVEEMPLAEILNPYEFDMYKTTWEYFAKFQKWATTGRRGSAPGSDWGILDLETGCDLLATQGAKGVTLDRCDPGPIFALDDANYDSNLQKIWSHLRNPQIIIPSEKQLLEVAVKVEEYAESGGRRRQGRDEDEDRGRGRRGRFRNEEDDADGSRDDYRGHGRTRPRLGEDDDEDRGGQRGRRTVSSIEREQPETNVPPPRRRSEDAAQTESQPEDTGAAAAAPPARRSSAPAIESPERRRSPTAVSEEQPEPEGQEAAPPPPPRRSAGTTRRQPAPEAEDKGVTAEDMQKDQSPAPTPAAPPPARRGMSPAAPPPAARRPAAEAAAQEDDLGPQKAPLRRASAAPTGTGVDEDEDNAPEERHDPAPPVRESVDNEAPPAVSASSPPARRKVGDASGIKARLDRLTERGR